MSCSSDASWTLSNSRPITFSSFSSLPTVSRQQHPRSLTASHSCRNSAMSKWRNCTSELFPVIFCLFLTFMTTLVFQFRLGITFLIIVYRCVECSVRHWEPWACLAHCRQFLCSVQVEFLPVLLRHWCRGSNSGYMLRDTCSGFSLHKAVHLSEFSSANSSDKLSIRQSDSHVTTNCLSVEHVEEIFTSHVGSMDQFGYHAQDLCIFLDPLTGEESQRIYWEPQDRGPSSRRKRSVSRAVQRRQSPSRTRFGAHRPCRVSVMVGNTRHF